MSDIRHLAEAPTETRVLSPGDEVDLHHHDDAQLIYASTGVLELLVATGTWFTPPTRAVWVPGGTAHRWQVHGMTTVHLVGVSARRGAERGATDALGASPALILVPPLVRELILACSENGPAQTLTERRMLDVLVDQIRPAPEPATMLPVLRDPRLQDAQALVEADLADSPSLPELARRVGASERTLSRLFHEEVGMTFTVWRTQLRLHRANLLLAEGATVTRTAAACGYSSPSAFIQTFRAAFGRTPGSVYR
ncbi:MAG TPA: AraC family transcriptional regulator [Brevibacterium sp.]|nr:AraC family transcriptional regulator [Brevibacterium sp.]